MPSVKAFASIRRLEGYGVNIVLIIVGRGPPMSLNRPESGVCQRQNSFCFPQVLRKAVRTSETASGAKPGL